jgi:hypothetical protein
MSRPPSVTDIESDLLDRRITEGQHVRIDLERERWVVMAEELREKHNVRTSVDLILNEGVPELVRGYPLNSRTATSSSKSTAVEGRYVPHLALGVREYQSRLRDGDLSSSLRAAMCLQNLYRLSR